MIYLLLLYVSMSKKVGFRMPGYLNTVAIEEIPVIGFPNPQSLFERMLQELRKRRQSVIYYLNVHVANMAYRYPDLKTALQKADVVYCDGAGISFASRLLGQPIPTRLTAADWFTDLMEVLAKAGCKVFLLGGKPCVPEKALQAIAQEVPHHTIVGTHHGYILEDPSLEQRVIAEINALRPDILIVGFGTPYQERWIEKHRQELDVSVIYAVGAVMDYLSKDVPRCPHWMGQVGLEWLYRLCVEPYRLFARYVIGNPWFLGRIMYGLITQSIGAFKLKRAFRYDNA